MLLGKSTLAKPLLERARAVSDQIKQPDAYLATHLLARIREGQGRSKEPVANGEAPGEEHQGLSSLSLKLDKMSLRLGHRASMNCSRRSQSPKNRLHTSAPEPSRAPRRLQSAHDPALDNPRSLNTPSKAHSSGSTQYCTTVYQTHHPAKTRSTASEAHQMPACGKA